MAKRKVQNTAKQAPVAKKDGGFKLMMCLGAGLIAFALSMPVLADSPSELAKYKSQQKTQTTKPAKTIHSYFE